MDLRATRFSTRGIVADRRALPSPLAQLGRLIKRLKRALSSATDRTCKLVPATGELALLSYPIGGFYREHQDGKGLRRSISFVIFFTDDGWTASRDGGALRVQLRREDNIAIEEIEP